MVFVAVLAFSVVFIGTLYPPFWMRDVVTFAPAIVLGALLTLPRPWLRPFRVLGLAMLLLPAGLILPGLKDYQVHLVDPATPYVWGFLITWLGIVQLIGRHTQAGPARGTFISLFMTVLATAYVYSTIGLINEQFDGSRGQSFRTKVVRRTIWRGRAARYLLGIDRWGPSRGGDYAVSHLTYNALKVGDEACVTLHKGLLQMRWFDISACP